MTAPLRNTGTNQLLLRLVQAHKVISTTTLSRWCVTVMKESGINVNIFGSHSTRSVSTPKCKIMELSFKEIAKSAGWSNEKTFAHFMIGQFKRTFQTLYSDEFAVFYMHMYIWCCLHRKHIWC